MTKVVYGNGSKCHICGIEVEKWRKKFCSKHKDMAFSEWYIKNRGYVIEYQKQYYIKKQLKIK